jgi:hypothetical protein
MASAARSLHPGIAQVYAAKVRDLSPDLAAGRDPETREAARALIDKVIIHPPETDDGPPGIEPVGDLMAMLQAGAVGRPQTSDGVTVPEPVLALFIGSVKESPGAKP